MDQFQLGIDVFSPLRFEISSDSSSANSSSLFHRQTLENDISSISLDDTPSKEKNLELINEPVGDVQKDNHDVKLRKERPKYLNLEDSKGRERNADRKFSGELQNHSSSISCQKNSDLLFSTPNECIISRSTKNTKSVINNGKNPSKVLHIGRDEYAYVQVRNKADRSIFPENLKVKDKTNKDSSHTKERDLKLNNGSSKVSDELLCSNCQTLKSGKSVITCGTQTIDNFWKDPNLPKKSSKDMKRICSKQFLQQMSQSKNFVVDGLLNQPDQGVSLEKSIQLAVSLEFDKFRLHLNDQCISMHKELERVMVASKKRHEVNEYLFSVIEELMQVNRQLVNVISSNN